MAETVELPTQPLIFLPLFFERIWGGRNLEALFGKRLPPGLRIGESWEVVDRPEAQSIVAQGPWQGETLHTLWSEHRREIFGDAPDSPRFPLLIKLLDAEEKLSVQVHPPVSVAAELAGEPKTEFWYIARATSAAELYVGLRNGSSRAAFEAAIQNGTVESHLHRVPVRTGDSMFLPSGRMHAIGAGNVIVEVQQNSDTTYRVFDWNRKDTDGASRKLHIRESLRAIDFEDHEPELVLPAGESLVKNRLFEVDRWHLTQPRQVCRPGEFAIVACLAGEASCAGVVLKTGEFFLVPACAPDRTLTPAHAETSLLRIALGR